MENDFNRVNWIDVFGDPKGNGLVFLFWNEATEHPIKNNEYVAVIMIDVVRIRGMMNFMVFWRIEPEFHPAEISDQRSVLENAK